MKILLSPLSFLKNQNVPIIIAIAFFLLVISMTTRHLIMEYNRSHRLYQDLSWTFTETERQFRDFNTAYRLYITQNSNLEYPDILSKYDRFSHQFEVLNKSSGLFPQLQSDVFVKSLDGMSGLVLEIKNNLESLKNENPDILKKIDKNLGKLDSTFVGLINTLQQKSWNKENSFIDTQLILLISAMLASGILIITILIKQRLNAKRHAEHAEHSEQRASRARSQLIDALESVSDGFLLLNENRQITLANSKFSEFYDTIKDEIKPGADFSKLLLLSAERGQYTLTESQTVHDYCTNRLASMQKSKNIFEQKLSNGRHLLVQEQTTAEGRYVSTQTDITDLKKAEELLESRLMAMETSVDGIALIDAMGRYSYLNKSYANLYGYQSPKELIDEFWDIHYDETTRELINSGIKIQLKKSGRWQGELQAFDKNKNIIEIETSLARMANGGTIVVSRNIGKRKQQEQEQEQLRQQLFQAQKMEAIGRLAGGIAHDFNNILSTIVGYAEFLTEDLEEESETHYFATQILAASEKTKELIDQILTFSRRTPSEREPTDMSKIINDAYSLLRSTVPKTVDIKTDLKGSSFIVFGNETQIHQIIMNLCVNAVDAMTNKNDSLLISTKDSILSGDLPIGIEKENSDDAIKTPIQIDQQSQTKTRLISGQVVKGTDYLSLIIEDTGSGMTPEVMSKIFEPFFTTKDVHKGTGLGLATVLGIVSNHNGIMIVDSEVGVGTKFEIMLPLAKMQESQKPDEKRTEKKTGTESILIVEDEDHVGEMLTRSLERMGYKAVRCENALEALDVLSESPHAFELIISDYTMPGMTGLELAQSIQEKGYDLPMILISGYSKKKLSDAETHPVVHATFRKPVNSNDLATEIRRILDSRS